MSEIHLCIPTVRKFDLLDKCVMSAISGSVRPDVIHVMDNSGGMLEAGGYLGFEELESFDVRVYNPGRNLGVAKSWNVFMELVPVDATVIISNDDVTFAHFSMGILVAGMVKYPECSLYYGFSGKSHYSLFGIKQLAWMMLDGFDETFYPGYFEDNDFDYRLKLAGHKTVELPTGASHEESATMKSYNTFEMDEHYRSFRRNEAYYVHKWGGMPGKETYTTPFGDKGVTHENTLP
jgi:GT2 family glycosyltransferase